MAGFAVSGRAALGQISPIDSMALSAQQQGNAFAAALLREDFTAVAATTCGPVLVRVGSAPALAQQIEVSFKVMQLQGRQLLHMHFDRPAAVLDGAETRFALVPYHSLVRVHDGRVAVDSYYLAVQNKDADSWCFIDTAALTAASLRELYPGAPPQLKLPTPAHAVFKGDIADGHQ